MKIIARDDISGPKIDQILITAKEQAEKFVETYKGKLGDLSPEQLVDNILKVKSGLNNGLNPKNPNK